MCKPISPRWIVEKGNGEFVSVFKPGFWLRSTYGWLNAIGCSGHYICVDITGGALVRTTRSFLRHPGFAQAIDNPVKGCANARIGGGRWSERLEHRDILDFRQPTLFRVTGRRIMAR